MNRELDQSSDLSPGGQGRGLCSVVLRFALCRIDMINHPQLFSCRGGQDPIVTWKRMSRRPQVGPNNTVGAGLSPSRYVPDRGDLTRLDEAEWGAVEARDWRNRKAGRQRSSLKDHVPGP